MQNIAFCIVLQAEQVAAFAYESRLTFLYQASVQNEPVLSANVRYTVK